MVSAPITEQNHSKEVKMKIQQVAINKIRPYENNPRKNDKAVAAVAKSIEKYGWQQPIVVDSDLVIIAGHTRHKAAKKLQLSEVPVLIAENLTPQQALAYRIMDNRSNENAKWDDGLLIQELQILLQDNTTPEVSEQTGFTEAEINRMFPDTAEEIEPTADINLDYISQYGDLWTLGDHKLLHGDSTSSEDIKRLLGDEKIDLVWEDPPYGVNYETVNSINYSKEENANRNKLIANDNLSPEQLDAFLEKHISVVSDYVKPGSAIYWCHDIRFTDQFKKILQRFNYHISDTLIWKKDKHSTFLTDYSKFYEPILYGWKTGAEHNFYGTWSPNVNDFKEIENMTREQLIELIKKIPKNVQEFEREAKGHKLHPTVKPTKLIVYHMINSSLPNQIVFDGFAGSGAMIMAAEKVGRKGRSIEFEAKYIDTIIKRWQDHTGLSAVRHDGIKFNDIGKLDTAANLAELFDLPIMELNDE